MKTCQLEFDFDGDASRFPLKAMVEWSDTLICYHVRNIHLSRSVAGSNSIPDIFIKCIAAPDGRSWVHSDSNRPSTLSKAVGKAIEQSMADSEIRVTDAQTENELDDLA